MSDRRESVGRTLLVAVVVSLACSVVVSAAAVLLKGRQDDNRERMLRLDILEVAGLADSTASIEERFGNIEPRLVDIASGRYLDAAPQDFDAKNAALDPATSVAIPVADDIAKIGRRADRAKVYLVSEAGTLQRVILPVHGYGLWSTMYGFIAVAPDGNTVEALKFYEHAETPGLGDKIDDPSWRARFTGKNIYAADGHVALEVIKGAVAATDPSARYKVDGISGATLTSQGVSRTLRYWLGPDAYGPYLARLRERSEDST